MYVFYVLYENILLEMKSLYAVTRILGTPRSVIIQIILWEVKAADVIRPKCRRIVQHVSSATT